MYIYRAVRSRGKSLQEGLTNVEYCHNIQLFPLTNSHADCQHLTPGPVIPSNAWGKRLPVGWAAPLCQPGTLQSLGARFLAPRQDPGRVRIWF